MAKSVEHCLNCGAVITGEYCAVCGQKAVEARTPAIGLVQDVLVETLPIDSKLWRTLSHMFAKPGRLARDVLDGKRARYTPPFRLFLFASIIFYLAFFQSTTAGYEVPRSDVRATVELDRAPQAGAVTEGESGAQEANRAGEPNTDAEPPTVEIENIDQFRALKWDELDVEAPPAIEPYLRRAFEAAQRIVDDPRLFFAQAQSNVPRFALMSPVIYGLLLALLYVYRRNFLLYDHFVVSLYMHAALYAYLTAIIVITATPLPNILVALPLVWGLGQPFAVLRQVYRSNWFSVALKGVVTLYVTVVSALLLVSLGVGVSLVTS